MESNLLDKMLDVYLSSRTRVTLTLQNKVRLSGKIKAFDGYIIVLDGPRQEIVYRHAVSSLVPQIADDQRRHQAVQRPAPSAAPAPKPAASPQKPALKPAPSAKPPSSGSHGLNDSLKDGLEKWMREQKAAK